MIGRPGTTLWLLGHELRLGWRRTMSRRGGGKRRWAGAGLFLMLAVPLLLTGLSIPMGLALGRVQFPHVPGLMQTMAAGAVVLLAVIFTLMLSQTLAAAVDALYERNDLDLLFSSPFDPRRVMAVRFLGVALGVFAFFGYFLTGPLVVVAITGHPGWLATLPVLAAVALAASGAGLLIAAALFRLIGPRRTRTIAQVLAALIGAAFFLAAQARNILGERTSTGLWGAMMQRVRDPGFHPPPGFDWPLRALTGDPLPLLSILAIGAGVFWIANAWLGPRFAADAAAAAGAGARGGRSRRVARAFAAGPFAATLRKEWRLLARDPALMTQVLLRVLYLLPLGFLLLRQGAGHNEFALPGAAAGLALMAGQVAGSLAWITISAEDAPDLLACAPAEIGLVRRGKLAAAVLPVAVLLAPILVPLAVFEPYVALVAALGGAASVVSTALLNLWWQRPAKRSEFRNRRRASWAVTVGEIVMGLLIGGATGLFAAGWAWGFIPAVLALVGVLVLRRTDAQISEALRAAAA